MKLRGMVLWVLIVGLILVSPFASALAHFLFILFVKSGLGNFGSFADYILILVNCIIGLTTVVLLYKAFHEQFKANELFIKKNESDINLDVLRTFNNSINEKIDAFSYRVFDLRIDDLIYFKLDELGYLGDKNEEKIAEFYKDYLIIQRSAVRKDIESHLISSGEGSEVFKGLQAIDMIIDRINLSSELFPEEYLMQNFTYLEFDSLIRLIHSAVIFIYDKELESSVYGQLITHKYQFMVYPAIFNAVKIKPGSDLDEFIQIFYSKLPKGTGDRLREINDLLKIEGVTQS